MKSRKAILLVGLLIIITAITAMIHLNTRQEIPENAIQISVNGEVFMLDIAKLEYEKVSGVRVNGKGEEILVEGMGIKLEEVLKEVDITKYTSISVVSDDSYSAGVSAEEIKEDNKVYLLYEEKEMRLVVFGDENSKRSVSNVVQIIVD